MRGSGETEKRGEAARSTKKLKWVWAAGVHGTRAISGVAAVPGAAAHPPCPQVGKSQALRLAELRAGV